jgi:tetratricopeptide (TPR) repeat protein
MRLFLFILLLSLAAPASFAQQAPELGPDVDTPSLDDLHSLPENEEDEKGGKVVADGADQDEKALADLFEKLAAAETPDQALSIGQKIQAKWLESGSDTVDALMSRAAVALRANKYGLALDLLDVVVTLKPDFAEGWNRRATVFYVQQDFGRSLADIERTLALEPRHWGALSGLAIIQRRIGEDDKALTTFRRALEINPGLKNAKEAVDELEKEAEGDAI